MDYLNQPTLLQHELESLDEFFESLLQEDDQEPRRQEEEKHYDCIVITPKNQKTKDIIPPKPVKNRAVRVNRNYNIRPLKF